MKKGKIIRIVLGTLFAAVIIVAAYRLIVIFSDYNKADNHYEKMRREFVSFTETTASTEKKEETEISETSTLCDVTTENASEETEYDEPQFSPFSVDFDGLLSLNPDVRGWLYCEGTPICYPVVQAKDNEYYLRRSIYGEDLVTGTIFTDCRNGLPMEDKNYIIYGHYMKNGSIFGCFENYHDQSYYESHSEMYYSTPEKTYKIKLFAGLLTDTEEFPYKIVYSDKKFEEFVEWAKSKSFFKSDVYVGTGDCIVTLSTCSYDYDNARTVLLGKFIPID